MTHLGGGRLLYTSVLLLTAFAMGCGSSSTTFLTPTGLSTQRCAVTLNVSTASITSAGGSGTIRVATGESANGRLSRNLTGLPSMCRQRVRARQSSLFRFNQTGRRRRARSRYRSLTSARRFPRKLRRVHGTYHPPNWLLARPGVTEQSSWRRKTFVRGLSHRLSRGSLLRPTQTAKVAQRSSCESRQMMAESGPPMSRCRAEP